MKTLLLHQLYQHKLAALVVLFTLLWVMTDISGRLTAESNNIISVEQADIINELELPQLAPTLVAAINSVYAPYQMKTSKTDKSTTIEENIMTAKQRAAQQGELTAFYIKDKKIALKAVIQNENKATKQLSALLLITNTNTGIETIEKVNDQQDVYGYTLLIENNRQVMLSKKQPQGLQKIILTMFKASKSSNT
jgi:hypothetical protein